jgi:hypothetical protein
VSAVLIAAAVCPHPPLLIPEVSGSGPASAAAEGPAAGDGPAARAGSAAAVGMSALAQLRAACDAAVAELLWVGADLVAVVGGAAEPGVYPGSAAGSLRPFGVPFQVGEGEPTLPLSLTIGRSLLHRAFGHPDGQRSGRQRSGARRDGGPHARGQRGGGPHARGQRPRPGVDYAGGRDRPPRVLLHAVPERAPVADCLSLGAQIAAQAPRVAILAMGDGPARPAVGVPGAADPAAERYQAEVAAALAEADPARLARLDPGLDAELIVAGRAAWQVLAGAADERRWYGRLRFAAAPLGVSYLVSSWTVPD